MPTSKKGRLYLIRNVANGKGYVGQTTRPLCKRFAQHRADAKRGSKFALHVAMRKYGPASFVIQEIAHCDLDFINSLEEFFIVLLRTNANWGHGYNMAAGGHGTSGWHHSKETKAKIAASKSGKKQSAEHVANVKKALGRK